MIVHAGRERTYEAETMPSPEKTSSKGQNYLSDPRISRDLPGRSRHRREPLETFRWMKAGEWDCLTGGAQLWFPVIFCVKVLAPRMPLALGAL